MTRIHSNQKKMQQLSGEKVYVGTHLVDLKTWTEATFATDLPENRLRDTVRNILSEIEHEFSQVVPIGGFTASYFRDQYLRTLPRLDRSNPGYESIFLQLRWAADNIDHVLQKMVDMGLLTTAAIS